MPAKTPLTDALFDDVVARARRKECCTAIVQATGLSNYQVRRVLRVARVPVPKGYVRTEKQRGRHKKLPPVAEEPKPVRLPYEKPNPMQVAFLTWRRGLQEKGGAYFLHGRPIRFADLMRKTNQRRMELGEPQLDACEDWLVK